MSTFQLVNLSTCQPFNLSTHKYPYPYLVFPFAAVTSIKLITMVPSLRKAYNAAFTKERYEAFLKDLHSKYPGAIEFRVAETPVFVDKAFTAKLLDACESNIDVITDPDFRQITDRSIPPAEKIPNEDAHTQMIAFDFGVCQNEEGELEPQLIEMQGFPTLFGFQVYFPELMRQYFPVPGNYR